MSEKSGLVKCLLCGEVFDASLGRCPVCGADIGQCVCVTEEATSFRNDTKNIYLILGGGIAAVSAAESIRERDKTGTVVMLTETDILPVNRPLFSKKAAQAAENPEMLTYHPQEWYDERSIYIAKGMKVSEILPDSKTVRTADGSAFKYDRLIYALGAESCIPDYKGIDMEGVVAVRHPEDLKRFVGLAKQSESAVILGAGVIGMEMSGQLVKMGVNPKVLITSERIMGKQLDNGSADFLRKKLEEAGMEFAQNAKVAEIIGKDGRAAGVRLTDGREVAGDFVLVATGNKGNVEIAKAAGIEVKRAVNVDEFMRTSVKDIYACGDCAEINGTNYQLWSEAMLQGKTAGANAAGDSVKYKSPVFPLIAEIGDLNLVAVGDPGKKEGVNYGKLETKDGVKGSAESYWYKGEDLAGAVIIGDPEKAAELIEEWQNVQPAF